MFSHNPYNVHYKINNMPNLPITLLTRCGKQSERACLQCKETTEKIALLGSNFCCAENFCLYSDNSKKWFRKQKMSHYFKPSMNMSRRPANSQTGYIETRNTRTTIFPYCKLLALHSALSMTFLFPIRDFVVSFIGYFSTFALLKVHRLPLWLYALHTMHNIFCRIQCHLSYSIDCHCTPISMKL